MVSCSDTVKFCRITFFTLLYPILALTLTVFLLLLFTPNYPHIIHSGVAVYTYHCNGWVASVSCNMVMCG